MTEFEGGRAFFGKELERSCAARGSIAIFRPVPVNAAPGDVIAGKYQVEALIGEGGMGAVLRVMHLALGERVAMKMLRPELASSAQLVSRFLREAKAAARIQNEHVARVMDVGTLPDGAPFMVMEYLEGRDLGAELSARGPLPLPEAVGWILQASVGVAEAHALGIVHRDLKPSNLFLARTRSGRSLVKVLDFGIAKHGGDIGRTDLTGTFSALGSAAYMSPEQIRAAKYTDARTDVWALGIVLFQLLTGRLPFDGETITAIVAAISSDPPIPLRELRGDAPLELEAAVMRCLEKNAAGRFPSLIPLAQALAPFAGRGGHSLAERVEAVLEAAITTSTPPVISPSAVSSGARPQAPAVATPEAGLRANPVAVAVSPAPAVSPVPRPRTQQLSSDDLRAPASNSPDVGQAPADVASASPAAFAEADVAGLPSASPALSALSPALVTRPAWATTLRGRFSRALPDRGAAIAVVVGLGITALIGLLILVVVLGSRSEVTEATPAATSTSASLVSPSARPTAPPVSAKNPSKPPEESTPQVNAADLPREEPTSRTPLTSRTAAPVTREKPVSKPVRKPVERPDRKAGAASTTERKAGSGSSPTKKTEPSTNTGPITRKL